MTANNDKANTRSTVNPWFVFDRFGIVFIIIFAIALAAFGFFIPEEPDDELAEAGNAIEAVAEKTDAAPADTKESGAKTVDAADAAETDDEPAVATVSTRASRGNTKTISTRTLYLGENDWNFLGVLTLRFVMNIFFAYILICLIFSKEHRIREYSFSYFVSNILIFMVTSLLASVRVRQGFAFGLFAILSILRFRTEQLQVREMTFLFAALIVGVINSLATDGLSIFAIIWANTILCMGVYLCDKFLMGTTDMINLVYDNTRLLGKDKKNDLHEDIKKRFGYDVVKVVVLKMNYLTDSAEVKLVYKRN